uniref:Uncharacterized protein n=1 Tax=Panagrolaimus sp. PS1159 TaxID=55785 RepID=A0AC35FIG6_9BILA
MIVEVLGFPGHDCTEPCLTQMQIELQSMEEMPGNNVAGGEGGSDGNSGNSATLSWSKILKNSQSKDVMEGFFNKICT